jgi:hypothetical protein
MSESSKAIDFFVHRLEACATFWFIASAVIRAQGSCQALDAVGRFLKLEFC